MLFLVNIIKKNAPKNEQLKNLNLGFRTNNHSICGKLRKMSFMKTKDLGNPRTQDILVRQKDQRTFH